MAVDLVLEGLKAVAGPLIQPAFVQFLLWVIASMGSILSFWTKGDRIQDESELNTLFTEPQTYDFIVVGGGSAGGIVTNRLSRANYKVLLLEAGGDPNPMQYIPAFAFFLLNYPETDWMHRSVPQKYASLNSINAQSSWSAGKTLGGSGSINLMIHLRGHKKDFDNWGNITGDPSWNWEGVLPFFKSYEDYEIPGDPVNHGYGGDLRIEAPDYTGTAAEFIRAGQEFGYPNRDLNAPFTEGFDVLRYPIKGGRRQSSYKAFIEPIRTLPNLTIMKFAHVNKILFRNNNEAYGVQFDRHGRTLTAFASKEVIITAGSVGTAKLLMLSGIGPRSHLEELNIPVISDLPVGQNLQDHLGVYLSPFLLTQPRSISLVRDVTPSAFVKWFTVGKGVLTSTTSEAVGIISSDIAKGRGEGDWPDITLFQIAVTMFKNSHQVLSHAFYLKDDEIERYYRGMEDIDACHVVVQGSRPLSRGYIKLGGSSPYDKPIIDPNYLSDKDDVDLKVLLEGVKKAVLLMENSTAFGMELGARFTDRKLPGCEHLELRTDQYWICFIRRLYSITLHHPVGVSAMGSVVNSQLKVFGTKNLRVADASVQPVMIVTNTQAATLMIGEKGAHMVLQDWKNPPQKDPDSQLLYQKQAPLKEKARSPELIKLDYNWL